MNEFLNAYTYGFMERRGFTRRQGWKWSLAELKRTTGCNAIILPVCAWQEHTYSTNVESDSPDVMDETDVKNVCDLARELGLKVILKAMVNCRDGYWRAYIHFFDNEVAGEPAWGAWFASWGEHVQRVARMARDNAADMLCVGCEMIGTDHRADEWRKLIAEARKLYSGPITYNCDKHQEDVVTWWDACDAISSSGYYPLDEIEENLSRIEKVTKRFDRPFLFMECGCPSREGSPARPYDWKFGGEVSGQAQADWYAAFTDALLRHPFVRGTGWWDWPASRLYPAETAPDNGGYCTYGKPANEVLTRFAEKIK